MIVWLTMQAEQQQCYGYLQYPCLNIFLTLASTALTKLTRAVGISLT